MVKVTKKQEASGKESVAKKEAKQQAKQQANEEEIEPTNQHITEINIGTVGHVDHGKTTLTEALTGKWTDTHSESIKRGITIKLGYADVSFYRCKKCGIYLTNEKCLNCLSDAEYLRTVSLVDAPGHETLMATVLSGASIMDGALLVIAANELCPQPQTREHLTVLDISGIKNVIVVQNKIDTVSREDAIKSYNQIKEFLKGTRLENAPIIPVSAKRGINIDVLIRTIQEVIKTPERDPAKPPRMFVARSFDINKPGTEIQKLSGGILGGSLVQGKFSVGDEIEIRPGVKIKDKFQPLTSKIVGLKKGGQELHKAGPGGLLGLSTLLDPALTKADSLSGNVIGHPGKLPPVTDEAFMKITLLDRVIGSKEELKVDPVGSGDNLMLTVGTTRTVGTVVSGGKIIKLRLKIPICAESGERVAISRQVSGRWRLIGWGSIA